MKVWIPIATALLTAAVSDSASPAFPAIASVVAASQQAAVSPGEMDTLVAPIALYPDALIAQILLCAQSSYQVQQVDKWLKSHGDLKGSAAQSAAQEQGFDACFIALVPFPQVLDMLASKPDWTTKLGAAFTANKTAVFDSIQRLRIQAKAAGNLQSTSQQSVVVESTGSGQQVIVIQPANPQIVYVPQYNPTTVYTQPAPSSSQAAGAALVGFAAGVIVGAAASDSNGGYCYGWGHYGGCCSSEGWNNYAAYRESATNDYYAHRENMASQQSANAAQRQDASSQNQAARQSTSTQNQASRQDSRSQDVSSAQDARTGNQSQRQDAQSQSQASREQAQSSRQSAYSGASGANSEAGAAHASQSSGDRGREQPGAQQGQRAEQQSGGSRSSAMSGYGSGSQTRSASSRGQQSMSGGGASRSGGGASRSGGGGRR